MKVYARINSHNKWFEITARGKKFYNLSHKLDVINDILINTDIDTLQIKIAR